MSEKLTELLASSNSPVVGPNTADALRVWIAAQIQPETPTVENVDRLVGRLALATKERPLIPAEAKERLTLFWRVLRDMPVADLAQGFDDLLRTRTFMPTPAEVYAAANAYRVKRNYRLSRARYLVMLHERDWHPPIKVEDRAAPDDLDALKLAIADAYPTTRQGD